MKELRRIAAAYAEIDAVLELEAVKSADPSKLEARQIINDQAYFLLCWGQLEREIDETCRAAVRHRRTAPDWRIRRGWDLFNPDDDRFSGLSFENRVRLVLDAGTGRGSAFGLVMKHYGIRNRIAHGTLELTRIAVSAFVRDCYLIQSALDRAL